MALNTNAIIALVSIFIACVPGIWFIARLYRTRRTRADHQAVLLPLHHLNSRLPHQPLQDDHAPDWHVASRLPLATPRSDEILLSRALSGRPCVALRNVSMVSVGRVETGELRVIASGS